MRVRKKHNGARSAIIIAAHKMYPQLPQCISSAQQTVAKSRDVILVDNGSGGVISDWATQFAPDIQVVRKRTNTLFCGGYNAGLRHAIEEGYEFALILNADSEFANTEFLSPLEEIMDKRADVAFLGPMVFSDHEGTVQNTCLRFPRFFEALATWLLYRILPKKAFQQVNIEREIEVLNGVCVLCRTAALKEIGLMDETFGGYVEDSDWSWRAKAKGWSSWFTPIPSVIHEMEDFGYEHFSFKTFLLKRNTVYFYLKTGQPLSAFSYAGTSILLEILRRLRYLKNSHKWRDAKNFLDLLAKQYGKLFSAYLRGSTPFEVGLPRSFGQIRHAPSPVSVSKEI
jgi:GT2 family glycosyltransferase